MDKFGRNYVLRVQELNGEDYIEIKPPFTIEFDINQNNLASTNIANIRIYNLAKVNRARIRKDFYSMDIKQKIELKAGYGGNLPVIFAGYVSQAWSVREGNNFITNVECFDGGDAFVHGETNEVFKSGTTQKAIITKLAQSLPDVEIGAIGDYPGAINRGNAYSGNTASLLTTLTGGGFTIYNGKVYCLGDSECIEGEILTLNSGAGLLDTPLRENQFVRINIIFEPRVKLLQKINLDSITGDNVNGEYKVISIHHKAMISEAVSGTAVTSLGLAKGLEELGIVQ